ncbi:MAG: hypothetical protein K9H16_09755 [Bacteroidales bacterium]|nr:hypothetical protein [Bacteroidales bacterium]
MELFTATYREKIAGELSCFDRVILTGTLPTVCHAKGMTSYLYAKGIRIFDYPKFSISEHGFVALALDTEGNSIGFHSNK